MPQFSNLLNGYDIPTQLNVRLLRILFARQYAMHWGYKKWIKLGFCPQEVHSLTKTQVYQEL